MALGRQPVLANFKSARERTTKRRNGDSESHLRNIRKCRCCIPQCNKTDIQAHHLKSTGERGAGMRSPDRFAVPLCSDHHLNGVELVGSKHELEWFSYYGVKALVLAADLWASRSHPEKMQKIVIEHRFRA